jgi:hypothetical protein
VGVDEVGASVVKTTAFRRLLLLIVAVEFWDTALRWAGEPSFAAHALLAVLASVCAGAGWTQRWQRIGTAVAAAIVAIDLAWQFPAAANHHYLELLCLALLLLLREEIAEEARLLGVALRWLLVIGLFYAGLQKLLYGYYFTGEFLAFTIPRNPHFALILGPLMPAAEFDRLGALPLAEGAGPFRVDSMRFAIVSNLAYLAELVLPPLLLWPRMRPWVVSAVIAYFVAIELAAREVFFGGIMVGLVLLFLPAAAIGRALPILCVGLGYLLAVIFGLLPGWAFT